MSTEVEDGIGSPDMVEIGVVSDKAVMGDADLLKSKRMGSPS